MKMAPEVASAFGLAYGDYIIYMVMPNRVHTRAPARCLVLMHFSYIRLLAACMPFLLLVFGGKRRAAAAAATVTARAKAEAAAAAQASSSLLPRVPALGRGEQGERRQEMRAGANG